MNTPTRTTLSLLFLCLICNDSRAVAPCESFDDIKIAQTQAADEVKVGLNKQRMTTLDSVVSTPQSAKDAGCLDGILGVNLGVFTVDFANLWAPLYDQFKSDLLSQACAAATDYVNQQTAQLTASLDTPFGSISLTQGSAISDWQSVVRTDVQLSNVELTNQISTGVLGAIPLPVASTAVANKVTTSEVSAVVDKITISGNLKTALDVNSLWGN
jgi:hypothetical protein